MHEQMRSIAVLQFLRKITTYAYVFPVLSQTDTRRKIIKLFFDKTPSSSYVFQQQISSLDFDDKVIFADLWITRGRENIFDNTWRGTPTSKNLNRFTMVHFITQ